MIGAMALFMCVPGARLHWPQVAGGYFLAMLAYLWETRQSGGARLSGMCGYFFPGDVWLHRSSLNDAFFTFMTFGLMISLFNIGIFSPRFYFDLAQGLAVLLPPAPVAAVPQAGPGILVFFTFTALVCAEFFYYWLHRMVHTVPALWEFHKVHHSAKAMTPLAVYRLHPVDFWLTAAVKATGYGVNVVIFAHFYPGLDNTLRLMGANAVVFVLGLAGGILHHSHIWISFGPVLERFVISPAQHQLHHSENPAHYNKNYSAVLAIWDWVFGTLHLTPRKKDEGFTIGLGSDAAEAPYQTPWGMLFYPFKANAVMAARRLGFLRKRPESAA